MNTIRPDTSFAVENRSTINSNITFYITGVKKPAYVSTGAAVLYCSLPGNPVKSKKKKTWFKKNK
jgi:hypothetical protein